LVSLNNSFELLALVRKIGWRVTAACFSRPGKLTKRFRLLPVFMIHVLRFARHRGDKYAVKYLKACQLAVQKAIAGTPVTSLAEIAGEGLYPRLDARGLPRIIPVYDRRSIQAGSPSVIRF